MTSADKLVYEEFTNRMNSLKRKLEKEKLGKMDAFVPPDYRDSHRLFFPISIKGKFYRLRIDFQKNSDEELIVRGKFDLWNFNDKSSPKIPFQSLQEMEKQLLIQIKKTALEIFTQSDPKDILSFTQSAMNWHCPLLTEGEVLKGEFVEYALMDKTKTETLEDLNLILFYYTLHETRAKAFHFKSWRPDHPDFYVLYEDLF